MLHDFEQTFRYRFRLRRGIVSLVRALFHSPLLAHGPEFGHVDAVAPRCDEEEDDHRSSSQERANADRGHGNRSNATVRANRFGVAVRRATVHASECPSISLLGLLFKREDDVRGVALLQVGVERHVWGSTRRHRRFGQHGSPAYWNWRRRAPPRPRPFEKRHRHVWTLLLALRPCCAIGNNEVIAAVRASTRSPSICRGRAVASEQEKILRMEQPPRQ
jgi:hypothetical protein